jgi:ATP-dependent helicase/DNAse subunit B
MPAAVYILTGPAGSGTTLRLLPRYRALGGSAVGAALWLGPTRRAIEALRERLVGEPLCCLSPQLLTFQDLADEVVRVNDPAARPLSITQRRLLLDAIVADLHARGELRHFGRVADTRGFAEGIGALLGELKRHEVWPADLARAAYRRGYAGSDPARGRGGRAISRKERECSRIYARYQQVLIRHRLYDPEGRQWYARDLLARGRRRPYGSVRAVFVDGFVDFTRTQHDILEALAGWVEEMWITLPDEPGDDRGELFSRPRATQARFEPLLPRVEQMPGSRDAAGADNAGLAHVESQLFRPLRTVRRQADADGIVCLEAPGLLGEARMVARRIKVLLLEGAPAEDILVTARDVLPYADLVREVFAEYGIPLDVEGTEPLLRVPAVVTLLRALRLPDDDWPFAAVTALLRSSYFRPDWPEIRADPPVAEHAEVLLRRLGEPRGRDAYLAAVRRWAHEPPAGLEDEQAEESRRRRTHELAVRCLPFLEHFFRAWDAAPQQAALAQHVAWLRQLAADLGIPRAAAERAGDAAGWRRLLEETESWLDLDRLVHKAQARLGRRDFHRRLGDLAAEAGLARTARGPGRVRFLSAELVRTLAAPYLFVMGLGERSFPRLAAPEPLFDEQERQALRRAGLGVSCVGDLMPDEMLRFYQVVTRAQRQLVLSYPAVDDRGQELLPSSFLNLLLDCFAPGAVQVERRRMLIERYDKDQPLSPGEQRVRVAASGPAALGGSRLPGDLAANLSDAHRAADTRLRSRDFGPHDGMFRHPQVVAAVGRLFGPEKVFSPTALEDYIACPFRFFLGHVLGLEPLEVPREEIEVTRRGQAFHRALSRLHGQLKTEGIHEPAPAVDEYLRARLGEAVEEYAARAPSPASKVLWRLEGQRLARAGARYRGHWEQFVKPWREARVAPRPSFFEVDFGLPVPGAEAVPRPLVIHADGIEVRVSGRIDRVDVAALDDGAGFWIIDYKTGRSIHHTATDLRAFRRLQLTLYALAVEQVLLAGRAARPLGLAYWLVGENGPKVVLPGRDTLKWLHEAEGWREVREQLQHWVATLAANIRRGAFALKPRSEHCTQTCAFSQICRIAQARAVEKQWELPLPGSEDSEGDERGA